MALTPEEQARLHELEAQERDYQDAIKGYEHIDTADAERVRPVQPHETRPFSFYRATVGLVRDAAQNVIDFAEDVGGELAREGRQPNPYSLGPDRGIFQSPENEKPLPHLELPHLKGEENAGTTERVVRAIGSFVVPFAAVSKTLGVAKAASWLGRAGRAMAAGAVVDATMDPKTTNLANVMRDTFGIHNDTLNELASEDDDNRLVARFKAAAVNAPLSLGADALFEAGLRGVRAYRAWRGSLTEADAAVKAAREEMPVVAEPRPEEAAGGGAKAAGAEGPADEVAGEAFDPFKHTKPTDEHTYSTFEDILTFLQKKAGLGDPDPELLDRFARNLVDGNPADTLGRVAGIDPLKIDFSGMDDPKMLGRLLDGLQEIYTGIAGRLGRTGVTVTEQMTARAARAMATSADVLKDLYGRTSNLDAVMFASQTLVGAHAKKMVSLAEKALAATKAGGGEAEWAEFLEAFHRQAYFLGALRGAGSEVGRALRSLQHIQKMGAKTLKRDVKAAVKGSDKNLKAAEKAGGARDLAVLATDEVSRMTSPAEKMLFLGKLVDAGGDLGDLSRFTRAKAGSVGTRLGAALGETRGNLFAAVTGVTNVLSGFGILGLNATAKVLTSLAYLATSPFGKTYSQAARVQTLTTWAYVDGMIGGWRAAFRNMTALLEREGMEEVVLNAEGWGAKGLAAKAAGLAEEGRKAVKGNFERIDISSRTRAFAMSEADLKGLNDTIQSWSMPALMQHSLGFILKAARPAINAAGTASRLGTILFVNGADQFLGTIAARAGAQAEAMRIAAHEAAELQLDGKALGTYMKNRMVQLTESTDGFADNAYDAGRQQAALSAGEVEAKGALFQDPIEFGPLRGVINAMARSPIVGLFIPFVKTPMRILERTAIDYTPLGLLKDRVRADLLAGGARGDEAAARIGLGMLMVYTAFSLADERDIVGTDGSYGSSARLARPSYTLKVGDDLIEFKRLDPIGTLLGWGADLRAHLDHEQDKEPSQRGNQAEQIIEAAVWATQENILSKTWLTSLRDIVDLASSTKEGQSADGWSRYLQSFATRFVPASGIQRSISSGIDGVRHEAGGFMEGLLNQSFGSSKLPVKRDPILGRPIPVESGERLFGWKVGPGPSDLDDATAAELERLSFDIGRPSHSLYGVRLNSSQFSRWLELRGQIVKSPDTGMTLENALAATIKLPAYKALPRAGKVQAIRDVMNGYSHQATMALINEDHDFARAVGRQQVFQAGQLTGQSQDETDRQTEQLFQQLGLTPNSDLTEDQ